MLTGTTAQKKILQLKKRLRIVQGGTSASKTFSIIPILIQMAQDNEGLEISVVAESIPHLKRGALKDFIKIMQWTNNYSEGMMNRSDLKYTFPNKSYIEFFSADHSDKLRGARRDVLFINECNNVSFEAYQQLAIRTKNIIYLDYNPTNDFWVHEHLMLDEDADFLILTYKDNEALSASIVKEIEKARDKAETSRYWANWWKVYGLGQVGVLEGVIFQEWQTVDSIPEEAKLLGRGIDFGYTNDPTAIVELYKVDNTYIFNEILYQKGLTNSDIARILRSKGARRSDDMYADSAEPKSIAEINSYGFSVKAAQKGKDSINAGIDLLHSLDFKVTSNSTNLINELRRYSWDTDRDGNSLNKPVDAFNHLIDAMRYVASAKLSRQRSASWGKSSVI